MKISKIINKRIIKIAYIIITGILCILCFYKARGMNEYDFDFSDCQVNTTESGEWEFVTDYLMLNEGSYSMGIAYFSETDSNLTLQADNDISKNVTLLAAPNGNAVLLNFSLTFPTDRGVVKIISPKEISLVSIKLTADHNIYTDYYLFIILLIILIPIALYIIDYLAKCISEKKKNQ